MCAELKGVTQAEMIAEADKAEECFSAELKCSDITFLPVSGVRDRLLIV
ncbi:hypothetical protein [Escherichia coli]